MADDFRRDDVLAMMIASDSRSNTGQPTIPNDFIAGLSKMHPDVFLPGWAVVDPWQGKIALAELERSFTTLGLTGAKWMPILQGFYPHDRKLYPIWDLCQSMGAPVLIHSGTTAIGSGMEGGAGLKLDYARPLPAIDTIAADFPRLTIVMAHPAWPWTEEAIAVLLHKSNVFMDVSGWRPRYMPDPLKREMTRRLQDKLLYGSDYPGWSPGQYLDELEMEGLKPGVIEKIFYKNAIRVLRLEDKVARARDAAKTGTARV
jgi:predicted TIM-barrel fold metal-dependent hydrolase